MMLENSRLRSRRAESYREACRAQDQAQDRAPGSRLAREAQVPAREP